MQVIQTSANKALIPHVNLNISIYDMASISAETDILDNSDSDLGIRFSSTHPLMFRLT